jgi:ABC-type uncharacterized transport system involved in gliding motility auxiliary subunit
MELKGKHLYGLIALMVGAVALVFAGIARVINATTDTSVQIGLAIGLLSLALFAWLELDLIATFLKTRQAKYGATAIVYTALIIAVVGLVNYLFSGAFDKLKHEWDLTSNQQNSLTPETLKVLAELKSPIKVIGFYVKGSYSQPTGEALLKRFKDNGNGQIDYQVTDPQTQPGLAQQYGVTADGTLVVTLGKQHENAKFADESELVNAIVRVENPTQQTIYFITGHGEPSPESSEKTGFSQIKTYLQNINYQVKTLDNLAKAVPVDASAMVVAGPTKPYSQAEVDNLGKYLAGHGKVIFMINPSLLSGAQSGDKDPLVEYLSKTWGITLRDDVVIDQQNYLPNADPSYPAAAAYSASPLVSPDIQTVSSVFPFTRSIELSKTAPADVTTVSVAMTSPVAWGETNMDAFKGVAGAKIQPDPNEAQGQLTLLATGENATTKARVVVAGDASFASNAFWTTGANPILFLNAIKWVTAQENLVTLSPKPSVDHSLNIGGSRDLIVIFLLSCLLPPLVVLGAGVSVWWSRRRTA